MRNLLITSFIFFFIFPINIQSQEFDQSFMDSLPEDIKQDLINRNQQKDELNEVQYRRPSSFIVKPEVTSKRYGSRIFSMMQSTLMPLNEPNFDSGYILDFGDVLEIQMIGQKSSTTKSAIRRDGSINIDEIGKIGIAGMRLDVATDLIKAKIDSKFIGVEVFVSLTNIRDIQVIVAGNVFNPGPYTLSGNSNIFHALSVSGGPSEDGSFRSIDLIRNNKLIKTIDLYDTFIFGKANFNERLRSGDLIFIRPYKNLVDISGAVKRPGQYELLDSDNLSSVITFANGLSNDADLQEVALLRIVNGTILKKKIYTLDELDIKSADKDSIFIRKYPFRYVLVNGAVKNPGSYILNQGDGIFELINKAGGYLESAYPFGGVLENLGAKEINKVAKEKIYEDFLNKLIQNSQIQDQQDITLLLSELKNTPVSGRLIAEFDLEKLTADKSLDVILQDGDEITVPEKSDQLFVFGEVSSQGAIKFNESFDIKKIYRIERRLFKNSR